MSVRSQLHHLVDDLLSDRPVEALAAARRMREQELLWVERRAVERMRRDGATWAGIGRVLGVSRQAARQRFGAPTVGDLLPPRPRQRLGDAYQRDLDTAVDWARRRVLLEHAEADDAVVPW